MQIAAVKSRMAAEGAEDPHHLKATGFEDDASAIEAIARKVRVGQGLVELLQLLLVHLHNILDGCSHLRGPAKSGDSAPATEAIARKVRLGQGLARLVMISDWSRGVAWHGRFPQHKCGSI